MNLNTDYLGVGDVFIVSLKGAELFTCILDTSDDWKYPYNRIHLMKNYIEGK